jgi:hypothetical protein
VVSIWVEGSSQERASVWDMRDSKSMIKKRRVFCSIRKLRHEKRCAERRLREDDWRYLGEYENRGAGKE